MICFWGIDIGIEFIIDGIICNVMFMEWFK